MTVASPAMALAIRAGMFFLFVSCLLGIATTAFGQWNLRHGQPYLLWGKAGVLKFPHGVALHAIQLLPLCAWLFEWLQLPRAVFDNARIVTSQTLFLLFAVWQTSQGRARFDVDSVGVVLLAGAF